MHVSASHSNVPMMKHKIDVMMSVYPWVQMVMFSELCPFVPLNYHAQDFPNETEQMFGEVAKHHGIWLTPGTIFKKKSDCTDIGLYRKHYIKPYHYTWSGRF